VNAPFQRGIMLVIGHDDSRRVVIQKPARVGYTKILAASLVYFASRRRQQFPASRIVIEYQRVTEF